MKSVLSRHALMPIESLKRHAGIALLAFILNVVAFAPLIARRHYSVDSYHLIDDQNAPWYLQNGRYTWWRLTLTADSLGLNLVLRQRLFMAICIVGFSISLVILTASFARLGGISSFAGQCCLCLTLSVVWINVFVLEFLLFPESAVSAAVGSIFVSLAVSLILGRRNAWLSAASLICLLIALGCYQSLVGVFLALALLGGCLTSLREGHEPFTRVMLRWAKVLGMAAFGSVFNVICVRYLIHIQYIADPGRGARLSLPTIVSNVKQVLKYQLPLLNNADGLMPKFSVTLIMLFLIALLVLSFRTRRNLPYGQLACAALVTYMAVFAPHYIEKNILLTPRSNMAFWAWIASMTTVFAVSLLASRHQPFTVRTPIEPMPEPDRKVEVTREGTEAFPGSGNGAPHAARLIAVSGVFLLFSSLCMADIAYDAYVSNTHDQAYALSVAQKIKEYEASTGQHVTAIAIVPDARVHVKYDSVRYQRYELNRRIMNTPYSNYQMINYLSHSNLSKIEMPRSDYRRYFAGRDWNQLDLDQQLVFSGDKAYLALY